MDYPYTWAFSQLMIVLVGYSMCTADVSLVDYIEFNLNIQPFNLLVCNVPYACTL